MAKRERNNAAEWARRKELAQERGFSSVYKERQYRRETKFEREIAGESEEWQSRFPGVDWRQANPKQLTAFYEAIVEPTSTGRVPTGMDKHKAVAYFIEWEDMSEDDAVAAMKEAFGYE